jgi:transketolase
LAPQEYIAVDNSFGESGTPEQLMVKYGLDSKNIIEAVKKVIARK